RIGVKGYHSPSQREIRRSGFPRQGEASERSLMAGCEWRRAAQLSTPLSGGGEASWRRAVAPSRSAMSAKTLIDLGVQTSPTALDATAEPTWAARPRLADAEMGDSSSQAALERLNQAVSELKALTIAPLL